MISKEKFVKIINRLKETDDLQTQINKLFRNSTDNILNDFCNAGSICIMHEDLVVDLLNDMFGNNYTLSWWLYEIDYGRKYKKGDIQDEKGKNIDLSTVEKLYDNLIKEME